MQLSNGELGKYLEKIRKEKNYSTYDVHNLTKISQSYISLIEKGKRKPSAVILKTLAPIYSLDYLDLYEKAGYIDLMKEEQKNNYAIHEVRPPVVSIDLLRTIKAGYDWIANKEKIGTIEIPAELAKTGDFFALKVKGDSMADAILEGDTVIIKKQKDCESGQIAAVLIKDDEVTVKRIKKTDSGIILQALNPSYEPVLYTSEEIKSIPVQIIGIIKRQQRDW